MTKLIDNIMEINQRGMLIMKLLENNDCIDHVLELIDNNDNVFHHAISYTISMDRFDVYQKLFKFDFWIDTKLLQDILSADPKYFECYLEMKEYHYGDITIALLDELDDLAHAGWIAEDKIDNIIHNMALIELRKDDLREIFYNLISIDRNLVCYDIGPIKIVDLLDHFQFRLDFSFAPLLAKSRLSLVEILLDKYYDYDEDIFIEAVRNHNLDLVKYLIQNYPIIEIDLDIIVGTPYWVYDITNFEKYYCMLKLLTDHGIKVNHTKLDESFAAFIRLAEYLRKY